ncbi:tetratricopeptide repeat protein [Actinophytocola sp.]|uniref:tetratricopeptide repeat protein n=1 Tax=Actinophytocola sp. TaxID=1872138 RepID=UPI002ED3A997
MVNRIDNGIFGPAVQAQTINGDLHLVGPSSVQPAPVRQMPAVPAHFTGREAELAHLSASGRRATGSTRMVLITGAAGVGKTALALAWLQGVRDQYPHGQLFADLQGHAPDGPAEPQQILGLFLRALGVLPAALPETVAGRSALFRSLTADRRFVVLLDNAASMVDVLPFVPGPPHSTLVVTSRRRMPGLVAVGAETLALSPLPEDAALALMTRIAGVGRVLSEEQAAATLVDICGGLPLAICLAAAQLVVRPRRGIGELVGDMRLDGRPLDVLSTDGIMSVRTALSLSYRCLPITTARTFRLLGSHPGPDFSTPVAAAAAGISLAAADQMLDQLADLHLVEELPAKRYRFHDLVRDYARELAGSLDDERTRADARRRTCEWYLAAARAADKVVMPTRRRLVQPVLDESTVPVFDAAEQALDWTETHLTHLLDLVRGNTHMEHDTHIYAMADAMWSLFLHRKHYPEWLQTHDNALRAARADGNVVAQTLLLNHLGLGLLDLRRFDEAKDCFEQALDLHHEAGDRPGQASALNNLGLLHDGLGRFAEAEDYFLRALAMQIELGERRGAALTRVNLARTRTALGSAGDAMSHLQLAHDTFQDLADRYNAARTTVEMAVLELMRDASSTAERLLYEAMRTMTTLRADHELARIRDLLAQSACSRGDEVAEHEHQRAARWHRNRSARRS